MKAPLPVIQEITLPDGRTITLETGRMARQADGSVLVRCGGTALLATVVAAPEAREGVDFMPLTVEYKEKFASAGRVPGGFLKREGRPSDREILVARLVDRVLRPLFPEDYHAETQVIITLLSFDQEVAADSLAGLAAAQHRVRSVFVRRLFRMPAHRMWVAYSAPIQSGNVPPAWHAHCIAVVRNTSISIFHSCHACDCDERDLCAIYSYHLGPSW